MIVKNKELNTFQNIGGQSATLATLKGLLIHLFTDSRSLLCSTYDEAVRRVRSSEAHNYADSVYTLRSKRSPAHILSRTPSRKNGSEKVYTASALARWASSVNAGNGKNMR